MLAWLLVDLHLQFLFKPVVRQQSHLFFALAFVTLPNSLQFHISDNTICSTRFYYAVAVTSKHKFMNKTIRKVFNSSDQFGLCDSALIFNPIQHGVLWITHTWGGGQILPAPYNSVISKDINLKFGMHN